MYCRTARFLPFCQAKSRRDFAGHRVDVVGIIVIIISQVWQAFQASLGVAASPVFLAG